jgi:nitrate reductase gamma subunit
MTDSFLFIVLPYLTAAAAAQGCITRYAFGARRGGGDAAIAPHADATPRSARAAWRWAIGVVAAGHLLALASPESVLRWNQQPLRLLALETVGLASGIGALAALIAIAVRRVRAADAGAVRPLDVIAWTLLLVEIVSGLAVALFYRWGSSWSAVTIAPYVRSLFRLEPDAVLVARLPLAARLHVFCAFALFAVVPYSRPARALIASIDRAASALAERAWSAVPPWCAPGALSARMQPLRVRLIRDEGEEN